MGERGGEEVTTSPNDPPSIFSFFSFFSCFVHFSFFVSFSFHFSGFFHVLSISLVFLFSFIQKNSIHFFFDVFCFVFFF